jgi:hypothetical protein
MYTIITTYPNERSRNVGDKLIFSSAIDILKKEKGEENFLVFFREDNLSSKLSLINQSRAVILPGFPLRKEMNSLYWIFEHLDKIFVPVIPMGSGWGSFPGDFLDIEKFRFSDSTKAFLKKISDNVPLFACRDVHTQIILEKIGVNSTIFTGDCGLFNFNFIGKKIKVGNVENVVITPPHKSMYFHQAKEILEFISMFFPDAMKYFSLHSVISKNDKKLIEYSKDLDFHVIDCAGNLTKLEMYNSMDLHIGYRLHGHISFLSRNKPSILLCEDGRSIGFHASFNIGTFIAFKRHKSCNFLGNIFGNKKPDAIIVDDKITQKLHNFLLNQKMSGFFEYKRVPYIISDLYTENMKAFLNTIP